MVSAVIYSHISLCECARLNRIGRIGYASMNARVVCVMVLREIIESRIYLIEYSIYGAGRCLFAYLKKMHGT